MRRYDVIAEICDYMLELGWKPYQNDHEDANGQFEMNWEYDDALQTADKHSFFKFMVKSVAEKHGLRATFMPKPFKGLTGNGCHAHISVWDLEGKTNAFADKSMAVRAVGTGPDLPRRHHEACFGACCGHQPDGQFLQAHQCAAHHLRCHLGAEQRHLDRQQPHPHGARSRSRPVRASPARRCGQSLPAAGDHHRRRPDGIRTNADPGRIDIDMYRKATRSPDAPKLPLNLLDALREYEKDTELQQALGLEFSAAYLKLKHGEWNTYCSQFTEWEHQTTLDI
jgi:hypothetical protein